MNKKNKHITLNYILDSLDDKASREIIFKQLRDSDPIDDEVKGAKLFLENNNYDYKLLQNFISNSKPNFNLILKKDKKPTRQHNWLKYAAVLLPLIGIGYYLLFVNNNTDKKLYSQYYEREVGLPVVMGDTNKILFSNSMNAYRDNHYGEAINGFNQLLKINSENDTLLYFTGCANMELGKLNEAIVNFREVDEIKTFIEKSEFRLALLYIRKGGYKIAKEMLEKIASKENHRYNSQSIIILKESVFNN